MRLALATLAALVVAAPAAAATIAVTTDAARYDPGAAVRFDVRASGAGTGATVTLAVTHLGARVAMLTSPAGAEQQLVWTAPTGDHQGYLVQATLTSPEGKPLAAGWTAVDVSSDASTFPRYGFVSRYDDTVDPAAVGRSLNDYHIDDVQFYDWEHASHLPLAGTPSAPAASWQDIAGRTNERSVVLGLLDHVHAIGAGAYQYDTLYNAWSGYAADGSGVDPRWGLYRDTGCSEQVGFDLPSGWSTPGLDLFDPGNPGWRSYILGQERDVFAAYPFDGWQVDQLGDQGASYACNGQLVDPLDSFRPFLDAAAAALGKKLVFNAVGQYGQTQVAGDPSLAFLYTEAWPGTGQQTYSDLADVLAQNAAWSKGAQRTVLAAYLDQDACRNAGGFFGAPGVLLADATIFAHGGDHIELGDVEHMLCAPYFPNANLAMPPALTVALHHYYDFLVAYENLLRDGQQPLTRTVRVAGVRSSADGRAGTVWAFAESDGHTDVLHLINLLRATSESWIDTNGTARMPPLKRGLRIGWCDTHGTPVALRLASPDRAGGTASPLHFARVAGKPGCIRFTVPQLRYWDMLWITTTR